MPTGKSHEQDCRDNHVKIEDRLKRIERPGMDNLMEWLRKSDFYTAPASTRFHGCYPGALAKHVLEVHNILSEWVDNYKRCDCPLDKVQAPGQKPLPVTEDNVAVACLLHDVCKIDCYIPTPGKKDPYRWNRQMSGKGHAKFSIARLQNHIELAPIEILMIRFHMGVYGCHEWYEPGSWEAKNMPEYHMIGDHSKDEGLTKDESKEARYGKSLRNAWYHNPICKWMYFADEMQAASERR